PGRLHQRQHSGRGEVVAGHVAGDARGGLPNGVPHEGEVVADESIDRVERVDRGGRVGRGRRGHRVWAHGSKELGTRPVMTRFRPVLSVFTLLIAFLVKFSLLLTSPE